MKSFICTLLTTSSLASTETESLKTSLRDMLSLLNERQARNMFDDALDQTEETANQLEDFSDQMRDGTDAAERKGEYGFDNYQHTIDNIENIQDQAQREVEAEVNGWIDGINQA